MKRYFVIYLYFLRINFVRLLAYRANFINSVIGSVGWGAFSILVILLLTERTNTVFGWTRNELLILSGCVNIFFGIFRSTFTGNFERFAMTVNQGRLDRVLLRPIDAQFTICLTYANITGIFRVLLGTVFVIYMLIVSHTTVSIFDVVGFVLLLFVGIALLYAIWMMFITLTIWYSQLSNLTDFLVTLDSTIRYPYAMYKEVSAFLLFIVFPFSLVVATPTELLLHKVQIWEIVSLIVCAIVFFSIARLFWQYII